MHYKRRASKAPPAPPQHTILLVEGDEMVRGIMAEVLHRGGFGVIEAATADQGLSIAARSEGAIDLAIIDMAMPGMSGLTLAEELEREYASMQTLYISGNHDNLALRAIAYHAPERVLLRPFTRPALLDRVVQLLEPSPAMSRL